LPETTEKEEGATMFRSGQYPGSDKRRALWSALVICLTCALSQQGFGQSSAVIRGTIIDAGTLTPIPIVNVIVLNTPFGAATDSFGSFQIHNLPPDLYVLEFRHVAYRKRFHVLFLRPSEQVVLTVELQEEPILLSEVEVVSEPERLKKLRLTHASTIITSEQIQKSGARRLSEVLRSFEPGTAPNASTRRRRSLFAATQWNPYLIFLDGQYVQDIPGALDHIIDVLQIERIEVSRWVGAAPNFGPGTSDRVLQIFTKKTR
jgi:hypothetical protein